MKRRAIGLVVGLWLAGAALAETDESPHLVGLMGDMQSFAHKLQLSLDAENALLADFYAHELGGAIAAVGQIDSYSDYPVGRLTTSTLSPLLKKLIAGLDAGDLPRADNAFDALLEGCNRCHAMTEHDYIRVQRNPANPYLQNFSVAP